MALALELVHSMVVTLVCQEGTLVQTLATQLVAPSVEEMVVVSPFLEGKLVPTLEILLVQLMACLLAKE